jgi:hypothetical protein
MLRVPPLAGLWRSWTCAERRRSAPLGYTAAQAAETGKRVCPVWNRLASRYFGIASASRNPMTGFGGGRAAEYGLCRRRAVMTEQANSLGRDTG